MKVRAELVQLLIKNKLPLLRIHNVANGKCGCGADQCPSPGKHPIDRHGVKSARIDHSPSDFDKHNVAVACGHNDLVVVDVDPRNGGMDTLAGLEMAYGAMPETWKVRTGSGGLHFYYKGNIRSFSLTGIDIQSIGKYVVAPPSSHATGNDYEWILSPDDTELAPLPDFFYDLLPKIKADDASETLIDNKFTKEQYLDALKAISPDCDYATWIKVGMAIRSLGFDYAVFDNWSAGSKTKYNANNTAKKWNTFVGKGVDAGSLIYHARQNGWEPKEESAVCLYKPEKKTIAPQQLDDEFSSNCPDWPPDELGIIAREIYENSPSKVKHFAIMTALGIVASIATMNYVTPIRNGSVSTYMVMVAGSSVGKEHFRGIAEKIVNRVAPDRIIPEPSSSQGMRFLWKKCNTRTFNCDEILQWIDKNIDDKNGSGNQIMTDVLKVWSLTSDVLRGYATKKIEDATPDVKRPALNIFGCGTEQRFEQLCKNNNFINDGLLSRMDIIFSDHILDFEHTPLDTKDVVISESIIDKLQVIAKKPELTDTGIPSDVTWKPAPNKTEMLYCSMQKTNFADKDAENSYRSIYKTCKEKVVLSNDPVIESLWARCAEKVVRTATCMAIVENPAGPVVMVEHMEWAWSWHRFVIENMQRKLFTSKGSGFENLRRRFLSALKRTKETGGRSGKGTATLRDLQKADRSISGASHRELQDCIAWLTAEGRIHVEKSFKGTPVFSLLS